MKFKFQLFFTTSIIFSINAFSQVKLNLDWSQKSGIVSVSDTENMHINETKVYPPQYLNKKSDLQTDLSTDDIEDYHYPGGVNGPLYWFESDINGALIDPLNQNNYKIFSQKLEGVSDHLLNYNNSSTVEKGDSILFKRSGLETYSLFVVFYPKSSNNEYLISNYSKGIIIKEEVVKANQLVLNDSIYKYQMNFESDNSINRNLKVLTRLSASNKFDDNYSLLSKSSTLTFGFDGRIAEILIFDRVVTVKERSKIESYLYLKYGIHTYERFYDVVTSKGDVIFNGEGFKKYDKLVAVGKDQAFRQSISATSYDPMNSYKSSSSKRNNEISLEVSSFEEFEEGKFILMAEAIDSTINNDAKNKYLKDSLGISPLKKRLWSLFNPSKTREKIKIIVGENLTEELELNSKNETTSIILYKNKKDNIPINIFTCRLDEDTESYYTSIPFPINQDTLHFLLGQTSKIFADRECRCFRPRKWLEKSTYFQEGGYYANRRKRKILGYKYRTYVNSAVNKIKVIGKHCKSMTKLQLNQIEVYIPDNLIQKNETDADVLTSTNWISPISFTVNGKRVNHRINEQNNCCSQQSFLIDIPNSVKDGEIILQATIRINNVVSTDILNIGKISMR